jgi:hypothetical protein
MVRSSRKHTLWAIFLQSERSTHLADAKKNAPTGVLAGRFFL